MMRNRILIAVALVLPLMQACERSDRSPTAAVPGSEKQARTPTAQDRMLESTPPAAGVPAAPASPTEPKPGAPGSTTNQSGDTR